MRPKRKPSRTQGELKRRGTGGHSRTRHRHGQARPRIVFVIFPARANVPVQVRKTAAALTRRLSIRRTGGLTVELGQGCENGINGHRLGRPIIVRFPIQIPKSRPTAYHLTQPFRGTRPRDWNSPEANCPHPGRLAGCALHLTMNNCLEAPWLAASQANIRSTAVTVTLRAQSARPGGTYPSSSRG